MMQSIGVMKSFKAQYAAISIYDARTSDLSFGVTWGLPELGCQRDNPQINYASASTCLRACNQKPENKDEL
jgi:hypothetical protein